MMNYHIKKAVYTRGDVGKNGREENHKRMCEPKSKERGKMKIDLLIKEKKSYKYRSKKKEPRIRKIREKRKN